MSNTNNKIEEIVKKYGNIETFIDENMTIEDQEFAASIGSAAEVESEEMHEADFGKIHLVHFYKEDDYVITISPNMVQRAGQHGKMHTVPAGKFKIAQEQILRAMAIMLDKHLPRTLKVTLIPPAKDWELEEYAAKIHEAKLAWQLNDDVLAIAAKDMANELSKHI